MKARAHVNFALIKYWGKKDEALRLPYQASLSFTVDKLYTETSAKVNDSLTSDIVTINGETNCAKSKRVIDHINLIRREYNISKFLEIESKNFVPTGAGLASSASSFAALTLAVTKAFNLDLSKSELSRLSRLASGSASRSIYGGFSIWDTGDDQTSIARPLDISWPEFRIIVVMVDKSQKIKGSTDAMKESVNNKESYNNWVIESTKDLEEMIKYLNLKDIHGVGKVAEKNANHMHDLIESTGISYRTKETLKVISIIKKLREMKIPAYYTMDAGPNVKIITLESHVDDILNELKNYETLVCKSGEDAHIIL